MSSRTLLAVSLIAAGCVQHGPPPQQPPPPKVTVAYPVRRRVADHREYTGYIDAVESVNIVARVRAFLTKINFQEGTEVKKGDLLYELDPREFEALLNQAKAKVAQDEAQLAYDEAEYQRNLRLIRTGAVSQSDLDKTAAARGVDLSNIAADKAAVASNKLNLQYTKVTAPISGRIGRTLVTIGNLVGYNEPTLLTTLVRMDPMYVYFDAPEADYLEYRKLMQTEDLPTAEQRSAPVFVGLATDRDFPHQGTINFRDNIVNQGTGTIQVRGVLPNPHRTLVPGLYARVRVPFGKPLEQLLVPEATAQADQRGRYVLVVNAENTVEYRPVTVGITTDDHMIVIEKGVNAEDRVVVNGVQKARPGATVEPVSDASQKRE